MKTAWFCFHFVLIPTCFPWFTTFNDIAHTKNKPLLTTVCHSPFPFLFLEHTCILSPFNLSFLLPFMCFPSVFHRHCLLPVLVFVVFVSFHFFFFSIYLRYFFPPLDPPRAGTRYGHLLPPSSLIEHCDAEPIQPQQQALPHRLSSRALLPLPEAEGQWFWGVLAEIRGDQVEGGKARATQLLFISNKDLHLFLYFLFSNVMFFFPVHKLKRYWKMSWRFCEICIVWQRKPFW